MGRAYVSDVKEGDIWYFPAGLPHSLQGSGRMDASSSCVLTMAKPPNTIPYWSPIGLRTRRRTYWPRIFGVPADTFSKIPLNQLYIFQGKVPGPLAADQAAVKGRNGFPPQPFTFSLEPVRPRDRRRRRGADRRQQEFSRFQDGRRRVGHLTAWRTSEHANWAIPNPPLPMKAVITSRARRA